MRDRNDFTSAHKMMVLPRTRIEHNKVISGRYGLNVCVVDAERLKHEPQAVAYIYIPYTHLCRIYTIYLQNVIILIRKYCRLPCRLPRSYKRPAQCNNHNGFLCVGTIYIYI